MGKKDKSAELSSDLLRGADEIAEFIFGSASERRKVYHLAQEKVGPNRLPCFRLGNVLHARKSTLLAYIAEREKAAA